MRKILCVVLAFLISSFSIISYVQAEEMTDLQTKQEELQNQINDATGELQNVQDELTQNLMQLQKLDERIEKTKNELEELNTKIEELQTSITQIEERLKVAEKRYQKQKKVLEKRLVVMYETGDTKYLDVILSSRSVSDFLSNYFLITELADYDTALLEEMEEQKNEIETDKRKLDSEKEKYTSIKQNQTKTAKILENTKIIRENYIEKLTDQEKEVQSKIDEYNRQFEEVNKEILSLALEGIDTKYIGGELAWPIPGYTRITSNMA